MPEPRSRHVRLVRHAPMLVSGVIFVVTFIVAAAGGESISALLMASLVLACIPRSSWSGGPTCGYPCR